MASSSRIPNQFLDTLLDTATLVAPYNTKASGRIMRNALIDFIKVEGYDHLKTFMTAALAALPTLNPTKMDSTGQVSPSIPKLGQAANALHSHWDGIPSPTFTYQWKRDGSNISGATSMAYTPVFADVTHTLSCTITATNTGSSATETVTAAAATADDTLFPHNTAVPTITGTGTVGQTLTGADGTWTPGTGLTFTIQWKRDGVAIVGATAQTYLLVSADSGHNVTFTVTGTNAAGQSLLATSTNKAVS